LVTGAFDVADITPFAPPLLSAEPAAAANPAEAVEPAGALAGGG
ncbi:MAG: hypothetical protein QOH84_5020, partial [Kribbellaceae bacterium]|nr:hypothetical protein [Kribbellaceae bacterium]